MRFLKQNAVFITLSLVLFVALGLALLWIPKGELHMLLCNRHTPLRDLFYRYYTQVAEWFPYIVCVLLLLFSRIGDGVFASAAMIFSALTTQLFKRIINAPRPLTWFADNMPDVQLPLVEGVRMNLWYSFPSGHTTSFFALAFVLAILWGEKSPESRIRTNMPAVNTFYSIYLIPGSLFLLAALGGYSRIYLSQHFAIDVFGGMCVGMLISIVCYAIFSRFEDQKWYNYRIFSKK